MFEVNIDEKINTAFNWIEDVPVAISISDAETLELIKCNQLFSEMFNLSDYGNLNIKLNGIKANDGAKSVIALNIGGISAQLFTSVKLFDINGKELLLSTHENLMHLVKSDDMTGVNAFEKEDFENTQIIIIDKNKEYVLGGVYNRKGGLNILQKHMDSSKDDAGFTLVYFIIEAFGETALNEDEALEGALSVVKSGTRQTDILAMMGKNDYILIFPKCVYEVVDSIMGTIEKKIEVFNETSNSGYSISIEYTISEYNSNKKQTPEEFVNELKEELA